MLVDYSVVGVVLTLLENSIIHTIRLDFYGRQIGSRNQKGGFFDWYLEGYGSGSMGTDTLPAPLQQLHRSGWTPTQNGHSSRKVPVPTVWVSLTMRDPVLLGSETNSEKRW